MTKNIGTKATQYVDLLTRAAIDMRYLAGDLSSWADEILSPRADIKTLTNKLDNCIAKLLAARRETPWIRAAGELAHGTSKSASSFRPSRPACVSEFAQGRNNVAPGESSNGGSHPLESRVEVRFEILDGKAQGLVGRGPACGDLSRKLLLFEL
ncbi:MAG: hypothetical protein M3Z96_13980 [Pseudomonadota bacterium]|nr:hypothetical protein [Pseudomonadota bacterium]